MAESLHTLTELIGSAQWRDKAQFALSWLREKYKLLQGTSTPTPKQIIAEGMKVPHIIHGNMYFYYYNPLTKLKLPYYDTFPLVIPIESYSQSQFLGINFHYLPYNLRSKLLGNLMAEVKVGESDKNIERFRIGYENIKNVVKLKEAIPCIHRYNIGQIRSRIIRVLPDEWATAIYLPVERFKKRNKTEVWSQSRSIINRNR
jgi:hypothetical protein